MNLPKYSPTELHKRCGNKLARACLDAKEEV